MSPAGEWYPEDAFGHIMIPGIPLPNSLPLFQAMSELDRAMTRSAEAINNFTQARRSGNIRVQIVDKWTLEGRGE